VTVRLAGKRAFITGAGQGIGRAIAIAFAREGATVVASSRTLAKMGDLPKIAASITPIELDVTESEKVRRVLAEAGRIDILVNNAGWVHQGTIFDCTEDDWLMSFDQNVTSCYRTMRAVLPQMVERGSGAIINVASVTSSVSGMPKRVAYGMSKAAVIGLTKAVARDVVRTGVRINALCPGATDSPSFEQRLQASPDPEQARRNLLARHPRGRLAGTDEVAAGAVYLASDDAAFVTGQLLIVDGGQTL
jgi:2-keto-3-deoxy-L-fuconate dehydrogenase